MYPHGELNTLHGAKDALRQRIALRRLRLAADVTGATRPLRWLDRAHARWRSLDPLVRLGAVPLGLWLTRTVTRRGGLAGRLLRWGTTLSGLVRAFI
jgi:hypothetical protein